MALAISGYFSVQSLPGESRLHSAGIESGVHAILIELDFVQPEAPLYPRIAIRSPELEKGFG
jgi:hypothetical protein